MSIAKEVGLMRRLTTGQLRARYAEVFGDATQSGHKEWLVKRIAWRLQVNAQGDISERARQRAVELANDADIRLRAPTAVSDPPTPPPLTPSVASDERVPPPGSVISRTYKGRTIAVLVREHGFEFEGEVYPTLSAAAKAITGSHLNGFAFFRLGGER